MSSSRMDCPECGAAMHLDVDKTILECPYCGNTEPLDQITADRLNKKDDKEVELERLKLEEKNAELRSQERREAAARRAKERQLKERRERGAAAGRKVKRIVFAVIGVIIALTVIAGIVEAIDDAQYNKERKDKINQVYEWPTTGLALQIDKPTSINGYVESNSVDEFVITVKCETANEFNEYLQSVIARGFTVDVTSANTRYEAYNSEGYHVHMYYYTSSKELEIEIKAPVSRNTIIWPTSGAGSKVPVPSSLIGEVKSQSLSYYSVFICDMDLAAFNAYVDSCVEAGFTDKQTRSNTLYRGFNADGVNVRVEYEGFNTIHVNVSE